jgi:hypothetical protein
MATTIPNANRHTIEVLVIKGDDVAPFAVRLRDVANSPIVLGDYTIRAQLRTASDGATVADTWTLDITDYVLDPALEPDIIRVVFSMTAAETTALGVGSWVWDLEIVGPDATWTPVDGTLKISQDVTR